MHVQVKNGKAEPYSVWQLRRDNPETSFRKEISAAKLAEFGVYPATVKERPATSQWQTATRDALPTQDAGGNWVYGWTVHTMPLDQAKAARVQELAARRYKEEVSGAVIRTDPPVIVSTDRTTQAKLIAAYVKAAANPEYVITNWKAPEGFFISLNAEKIIQVANAVEAHVQACFSNEAALSEQIANASSLEELDAVNLDDGWP